MLQKLRVLLSVSVIATLAACGGGSAEDAADKYVGTWKGCQPTGNATYPYFILTFNLAKASANAVGGNMQANMLYSDAACKNFIAPANPISWGYSATITGTRSVQGNTVDAVDYVLNGAAGKDVLLVSGSNLHTGAGVSDSAGYPTALSAPFAKQ